MSWKSGKRKDGSRYSYPLTNKKFGLENYSWDFVKYSSPQVSFEGTEILPNLFIGNYEDGTKFYKEAEIDTILSLSNYNSDPDVKNYLNIPINEEIVLDYESIDAAINYISDNLQAGNKVLVHCDDGSNRSPSIVMAFLLANGASWNDAYRLVMKRTLTAIDTNTLGDIAGWAVSRRYIR